jgi:cytochrome c55X
MNHARLTGYLRMLLLPALLTAPTWAQTEVPAMHVMSPDPSRRSELIRLVREDCGSCHGRTLKGGLGNPLTPQALHDKPVDSLVATLLNGRPGTAMPPWQTFLNEAEARWIVQQLLDGFPEK